MWTMLWTNWLARVTGTLGRRQMHGKRPACRSSMEPSAAASVPQHRRSQRWLDIRCWCTCYSCYGKYRSCSIRFV